jgi:hypothetical protein
MKIMVMTGWTPNSETRNIQNFLEDNQTKMEEETAGVKFKWIIQRRL